MAGYTGEKRWRNDMNPNARDSGVSELAKSVCSQMLDALTNAEAAYAEMAELYTYAGGTIQDLANLLFTEDIAARGTPGTNAVLSVNITGGNITSVSIDNAGTGYVDGNYQLTVVGGTDGKINYTVSGGNVTSASVLLPGFGYPDGSSVVVSNFPLAGLVPDTTANAEEVAKTQAAFDAITALHELYQAASNVAVPQEDRLAQIRRMT